MKITSQEIKEEFERNGIHFAARSMGLTTTLSLDTLTKVFRQLIQDEQGHLFGKGDLVNVEKLPDDDFNQNFTGRVIGLHGEYIMVRDQDGDVWDCEPGQLSIRMT